MAAPWAIASTWRFDGRFAEAVGGDMLAKISAAAQGKPRRPARLLPARCCSRYLARRRTHPGRSEEVRRPVRLAMLFLISWIAPHD
ncbi:MAG: hypothetical protein R3C42_09225 [Parvularculaceae bacterium]